MANRRGDLPSATKYRGGAGELRIPPVGAGGWYRQGRPESAEASAARGDRAYAAWAEERERAALAAADRAQLDPFLPLPWVKRALAAGADPGNDVPRLALRLLTATPGTGPWKEDPTMVKAACVYLEEEDPDEDNSEFEEDAKQPDYPERLMRVCESDFAHGRYRAYALERATSLAEYWPHLRPRLEKMSPVPETPESAWIKEYARGDKAAAVAAEQDLAAFKAELLGPAPTAIEKELGQIAGIARIRYQCAALDAALPADEPTAAARRKALAEAERQLTQALQKLRAAQGAKARVPATQPQDRDLKAGRGGRPAGGKPVVGGGKTVRRRGRDPLDRLMGGNN